MTGIIDQKRGRKTAEPAASKKIEIDYQKMKAAFNAADNMKSPEQWDKDIGKCHEKFFWNRAKCWTQAPVDVMAQKRLTELGQNNSVTLLTKEEFKSFQSWLRREYKINLDFNETASVLRGAKSGVIDQGPFDGGLVTLQEVEAQLTANDTIELK